MITAVVAGDDVEYTLWRMANPVANMLDGNSIVYARTEMDLWGLPQIDYVVIIGSFWARSDAIDLMAKIREKNPGNRKP